MTAYRTRWARMCSERWLRLHWRCHGGVPGLLEKLLPRHDGGLPWPQLHREQLPPARGRGGGRWLRRSESGRRRGNGRGCRRRCRNPSRCGSGRGGGGRGGGRHGVFHGEAAGIGNSRGHGIRSKDLGFWGAGVGCGTGEWGVEEEVGSGLRRLEKGGTKTPSVLVEAEGVARAGSGELAAVDFSSPLGWLLVSPPRTRPCLRNRNGRAWTCGTGGCLFLGLGLGNTKTLPRGWSRGPLAHGPRVRDWPTPKARCRVGEKMEEN